MAWTTPRTWVDGEIPNQGQFNEQIRGNFNALYERTIGAATGRATAAAVTIPSGTTADILSVTLSTTGGDIFVTFTTGVNTGTGGNSGGRLAFFTKLDNGADVLAYRYAGRHGDELSATTNFFRVIVNVPAGEHTITVRCRDEWGGVITINQPLLDVREFLGTAT